MLLIEMGNDKQTEAWKKGFEAGSDSVMKFLDEKTNYYSCIKKDRFKDRYIDWCNADKS